MVNAIADNTVDNQQKGKPAGAVVSHITLSK